MPLVEGMNRSATPREGAAVFGFLLFIGAAGIGILNAVGNHDAIAVDRLTMTQRAARSQPGDSGVYAIAEGQLRYLEAQEAGRWGLTGYATVATSIAAVGIALILLSRRLNGRGDR